MYLVDYRGLNRLRPPTIQATKYASKNALLELVALELSHPLDAVLLQSDILYHPPGMGLNDPSLLEPSPFQYLLQLHLLSRI
jgi:hypothetical protein